MYIKPDRKLRRHRGHRREPKRYRFVWVLLLMLVLGAGSYVGYLAMFKWDTQAAAFPTTTPMPTPTPSVGYYISEAEDARFRGSMVEAIDAYQLALNLEPNQTDAYIELARLLTLYGEPERGLGMAQQALIRQPDSPRALAVLGRAYDWLGMPDDAVRFCRQAVQVDPTLAVSYAYLAEALVDNGQWFAANDAIATALELDDTNVEVIRNQGYVLENQGNYYGAIDAYRNALEIDDRAVHLYMAIGRNTAALGNLYGAEDAYASAVEIAPDYAIGLDWLGWIQLLLGDYESAEANLLAAIEADERLGSAYSHLATLYFQQRNYEDAIEYFKPGIEYGEARSRRRVVRFVITAETVNGVGARPAGDEVARVELEHPVQLEGPLRGEFSGIYAGTSVEGRFRFEVMDGRYQITLTSLPPVPQGEVFIGWFVPLYTPEGTMVRTEPIFPSPGGAFERRDMTGVVQGPPIENYYTYALSYYLLDQCNQAMPHIRTALRIDPEDANALKTLELCGE
jgi:tetratricopeptide (TPR) repeat protein